VIHQIHANSKVEKRIKSTPPFLELDGNDAKGWLGRMGSDGLVEESSPYKFSVVRFGLCNSPVGAFDSSRGIYPTGENINYSSVTYVTR
jgi:hypothetical protein